MPTVLRNGPYRIFFYSSDGAEAPHVHVERDNHVAKFWLDPVRLHSSGGFDRGQLHRIRGIVEDNRQTLLEAWHGYFDN